MGSAADTGPDAPAVGTAAVPVALDPRLHDLSSQRLVRRYRHLLWWVATPVFLLLGVLGAWQAQSGHEAALAELARSMVRPHAELQALTRTLADHVADLRQGAERDLLSPPRAPDAALHDWLESQAGGWTLDGAPTLMHLGLAQLLWPQASPPPDDVLWRLQALSQTAERAHVRRPEIVTSFQWGWPEPHLIAFPWTPSSLLVGAQQPVATEVQRRFEAEPVAGGTPERNPSRQPYWRAPVRALDGSALVAVHAAPLYIGDDFRGIVGAEVAMATIERALDGMAAIRMPWWLLDEQGRPILQGGPGVATATPPPASAVAAALRTPGVASAQDGGQLVAVGLTGAPWTLVTQAGEGALALRVLPRLAPFMVLGAALVAMFVHGQQLLRRRVIEPALTIMGYLQARSVDERAVEPRLSDRWQPWARVVTTTFEAQREARLRERRSEAFKAAVVDQALAAIVTVDGEARVVDWNPAAEAMFGRPRDAVIGHPVAELIAPQHRADAHARGLARVAGRRVEFTAQRADGTLFPVEMQVNPIDVDGVVLYSAFVVDVSERARAAAEIERQREALRQSEKLGAMGGLLAGVAHELNNPLAIVLGRATLLESKTEGTEAAEDARRIRDAAERCGRIVRSFLNMARSRPAKVQAVQLNDLVRAAHDLLAYTLRTSGIAVELALAEDLPRVQADEDRLGQLLMNLLVNAQQALSGHAGDRRLRIETGADPTGAGGAGIWMRVADSGPGIPAPEADRIFTPYYTTKVEGAGTGLGLAVARSVAQEHGGDLQLERPGPLPGACFRLWLPLGEAASAAAPASAELDTDDAPALRVLVVDDETDFADVLRESLEGAGYEVATAESGAVALELLAEARFDAIVSDLRMPDMDGAALWQAVREQHPALARRMLFITGDTLSAAARQLLAASGCEALEKPFAPAELLRRIRGLAPDALH